MRDGIRECIEEFEKRILDAEQGKAQVVEAMDMMGLSHMKLSSAQVIALLDMLSDGITPVSQEIVTAMLGVTEAQKKFLMSLAGILDLGAVETKSEEEIAEAQAEASQAEAEAEAAAVAAMSGEEVAPDNEAAPDEQPATRKPQPPSQSKEEKQAQPQAISSIRVATDRLDRVIEHVGKLMVTYAVIAQSSGKNAQKTSASLRELDTVINKLQNEVDAIRLVPLKQIFMPMHRLVKSLSQKIGKKLEFVIKGEELALDKTIVESLNEPLVHLLRNAVDHGLENPEERAATGKPETGSVTLSAWRKGEEAFIEVRDDGKGLDPERIHAKAIEKGIADPDRDYSDKEILQFVLESGFSTAAQVTDVSGRGVGMDAVVNAIRVGLDGDIRIDSVLGKGATFTIVIPLDRSANEGIVDAIITRLGDDIFIIPSRDVMEIYVPTKQEVVELPDGRETVDVRGEVHSLLRLGDFLDIKPKVDDIEKAQCVVVRVGEYKAAILVDEVLKQQQVVITRFTVPVEEVFHLPILGFGMMGESDALVVDTEELLNSAGEVGHQP
ncbi:chemotaxis protein CheA [Desulfovibrio oxyclinae]|jgi:two-component system chemotaxis sensor kinase CheA|uniref:chemotaxis protein CheA n=1 Tax=Desulfovibrio oxyclinae TaxID=63560 RepID=UPI00036A8E40|nr:ATP-binding protein [Desulfovibrio oxyclinae]